VIRVLFFARVKEQLGTASLQCDYGSDTASTESLRRHLAQRDATWAETLGEDNLICAVNHTVVSEDTDLNDGDEVAFYPPVTGG
jgi:molybdopterin synthase sulfur carrier subunit